MDSTTCFGIAALTAISASLLAGLTNNDDVIARVAMTGGLSLAWFLTLAATRSHNGNNPLEF